MGYVEGRATLVQSPVNNRAIDLAFRLAADGAEVTQSLTERIVSYEIYTAGKAPPRFQFQSVVRGIAAVVHEVRGAGPGHGHEKVQRETRPVGGISGRGSQSVKHAGQV